MSDVSGLARLFTMAGVPERIQGFEGEGSGGSGDPDLSALDGLSEEDLEALQELQGLSPEEIKALKEVPPVDEKDQAIEGLRGTLKKERVARREAEKRSRQLEARVAKLEGGKPKSEGEEGGKGQEGSSAKDEEAERERQKSERLAASFANNAVDTAIIRVLASGAKGVPKFTDTDDVLRLIDRDDVDVEQGDEDPSKVKVDEDDVKAALKSLAKRKPHLLAKVKESGEEGGEGEGGKGGSGSRFGGGRKGSGQGSEEDRLKQKYPALTRR